MTKRPIFQVEDDQHDVFFLQRAFEDAGISNPLHVAYDGQEAVDYLSAAGSRFALPCLIILDLKMPRKSGLEVLQWLRNESGLPPLPVIVFSSSAHAGDIEQAYRLGANAFVVKPQGIRERAAFARAVKDFWLRFNEPSPVASETDAASIPGPA